MKQTNVMKLIAVLFVFTLLFLSACATTPTGNIAKEQTIKIGYLGPMTGPGAIYGEMEVKSINMALEELNFNMAGKRVELIVEDSKCDAKESVIATQKLVNVDDVDIILGTVCSAAMISAIPITEENEVILITGAASSNEISDMGEYIFRLTPPDKAIYGPEAEYFFNELGYNDVALIFENTAYGNSASESFIKRFNELGGTISAIEILETGQKDFRTNILRIKSKNPQAIVLIPQPSSIDGGFIAKQIKEVWSEAKILGSYPMESQPSIDLAEGALEGAVIYSVATSVSSGKSEVEKYISKYNEEPIVPYVVLESVDRINLLNEAINFCGEVNTNCMKTYFYDNDFEYSLGIYGFDEQGDIDTFYIGIYEVKNGSSTIIQDGIEMKI